jgi:hypothetical protein
MLFLLILFISIHLSLSSGPTLYHLMFQNQTLLTAWVVWDPHVGTVIQWLGLAWSPRVDRPHPDRQDAKIYPQNSWTPMSTLRHRVQVQVPLSCPKGWTALKLDAPFLTLTSLTLNPQPCPFLLCAVGDHTPRSLTPSNSWGQLEMSPPFGLVLSIPPQFFILFFTLSP